MPLALGALLFLGLLIWLQSAGKQRGTPQKAGHVLLGSLAVGAVMLLSMRSGVPWLGIATALLWTAWQRYWPRGRTPPGAEGARAGQGAGPGAGAGARPDRRALRMTRKEALEVLGLREGATREEILAEYRRLMKKVHPDLGGSDYLAKRLNEAKDALLGGG